jgi:hypothetical protein
MQALGLLNSRYLASANFLSPGKYYIDYTDDSHLKTNTWIRLLRIQALEAPNLEPREDEICGVSFSLKISVALLGSNSALEPKQSSVILDQIAQALLRTGILRPKFTQSSALDAYGLAQRQAVTIIPDTQSLANGCLHWLLSCFQDTSLWILPVVVSLTQLQQRHSNLKALRSQKEPKISNLATALRSRSLVNAGLSLLERCRERYQILEVDPQLLRYLRPGGKSSADPDQGDVLEDRLLIEAIHSVFAAARSRTEKRVLTSDVLLARVLHAEAIPFISLQVPILRDGDSFSCIRFEPFGQCFQGAPLSHLLWDLAGSFGTVRLVNADEKEHIRLALYWPEKSTSDWLSEMLLVSLPPESDAAPSTSSSAQAPAGAFSRAAVPEASLLQVLRVAGSVLDGAQDLEGISTSFAVEDCPTLAVTRMALEILLRTELITVAQEVIRPTDRLRLLDRALEAGSLDEVSGYMEGFSPYGELLRLLSDEGSLPRTKPSSKTRERLFSASQDAIERLLRFPVYLGQAWTDEAVVRNGSRRPTSDELLRAFVEAFEREGRDRLAPLSALLPDIARTLNVSPWYLRRELQKLVESGRLEEYSFAPAVGKKASPRDQVLAGSLRSIRVEPIPLDRLQIAGRPVFTVEKRESGRE